MRTQDIVAKAMQETADDLDLTLAVDTHWGNTGHYRFYAEDLAVVADISYNFQDTYCTFKADGLPRGTGYVAHNELIDAVAALHGYVHGKIDRD